MLALIPGVGKVGRSKRTLSKSGEDGIVAVTSLGVWVHMPTLSCCIGLQEASSCPDEESTAIPGLSS